MVIVDHGTGQDPAALAKIAAAVQQQTLEDFSLPPPKGWGLCASIRVARDAADIKPNEWVIGLFTTADQPGALGYHDKTPAGLPLIKVFPLLDPGNLSVTISHEVLEALADPLICLVASGPDGKFWALEVCDSPEAYSYDKLGVRVSDFVTPLFFSGDGPGKLDHMGLIKKPLEILPGGYGQWFDSVTGWHQVEHAQQAPRAYRRAVSGRSAIRRAGAAVRRPMPRQSSG
jgi:hypothetical protein